MPYHLAIALYEAQGVGFEPTRPCGQTVFKTPEALKRLGVKHLYAEPKQMVIDGNFPTVVSPNPENPEGFYLAVGCRQA